VSERADELRRQRDLLRENLAWIEKELAAEESRAPEAGRGAPPPLARPESVFTRAPADNRDAEAILAEYPSEPIGSIASKTKLGCVMYFVVAMVLFLGAMVAFYLHTKAATGH
jgi:hypothetical protein